MQPCLQRVIGRKKLKHEKFLVAQTKLGEAALGVLHGCVHVCEGGGVTPLKFMISESQFIDSPRSQRWPRPPLRRFCSTALAPASPGC